MTDFSTPIRQSSKGIIVIFAFKAFTFFKKFFVLFIAFGVSLLRKKSIANLSTNQILLILLAMVIALLVFAVLKYLNFKFHLNKDDFHLSTGIINKEATIVPKSKIQNVYIKQNFLQQLINVVSLKIETAGDNKSEIEISALDKPTALRLKKELFNRSTVETNLETSYTENTNVFFKVSPKRLLLEGISQNHLKSFLLITSFVFGLYYEFKDYVIDLKLKERFENTVNLNKEDILSVVLTNIAIVVFVVLISLLFSVIKNFIVNFNLEVIEKHKTIEINKGLFNKISLSLTPSRIQNIVIKTNRVKQYFGLHALSVNQAMVNAKQRKNFVIIALEKVQLEHLVNKLLNNYTSYTEAYKPVPFYKRVLGFNVLKAVVIVNLLTLFFLGKVFWWLNLLVIPIALFYIYFGYKKSYYKVTDRFVTIGSGVIDTTTNILETHKIQAIKLKQNIFQKRRRIASVVILTASKAVTIPYIEISEAKAIYNFLIYKVESQDKDWM